MPLPAVTSWLVHGEVVCANSRSYCWQCLQFQWARPTGFNNELSTEQSKALVGNATVLRVGSVKTRPLSNTKFIFNPDQIGSDCIAVGTSRGLVLCFEMSSQLKMTLRIPDTGSYVVMQSSCVSHFGFFVELERHPVSALGFSQDGKVVAAGFRDGSFALWDLSSSKLLRFVAPASVPSPASSHQRGCSVLHITFLGSSSELLTADDRGVVIHHSLSRAPMLIGDKRARIHGASPDGRAAIVPTTIFGLSASSDWSSDPWTEEFGLFALCTPYKLAVMSLRPELATHYKLVWNQDTRAPKGHSGTVLPIHEVGDTASVPLARSNDQDEDVSPFSCMAWAPMDNPKNSTRSQSFANTHRLLACSRGTTLNLIQVRPVNKMSAQGTTARGVTGFRAVLHEGWTSPATIVGLWFLDKDVGILP